MMTYRSNPFNQIDYSKFSFKKSEILEILKAVNSNFDFDEGNEAKHQIMNTQVNHDVLIPQNDYKFFLFKKPLLTFHEASCIMTGYDPQYVEQCRNDTNFKQNFSNYLGAKDYIDACCDAHMLCYNPMDNRIDAKDFKQFLANNDTFIAGFNDILKSELTDQSLDNQNPKIDQLKKENEKLKAKLLEKDQKIKELELIQTTESESKLGSTRAENNVTKLLLVLAKMADIDVNKPHAIHDSLLAQADLLGVDKFPSDETVKKWLIKANNHINN